MKKVSLSNKTVTDMFYSHTVLSSKLWIFMQVHIFMNTTEKMKSRQRFVSSFKYYNEYVTGNILYILANYDEEVVKYAIRMQTKDD